MNKIVFVIIFALLASFIALWYRAPHSSPSKQVVGSINVGTNAEYAPFSFMDDGKLVGFDIDLMEEIGNRLGKKVFFNDMPFDALIPALQMGNIQIIIGGITPTAERQQRVLFTTPYISQDPLLIVSHAQSPLTSLDQLKGKKIAVNEGYTADFYMSQVQGPELLRLASPLESFMALESHRADALVIAQTTAKNIIEHFGNHKFKVTPIPDIADEYALAISKQYPDLHEEVQKVLDHLIAQGIIEQLKKKWKLSI